MTKVVDQHLGALRGAMGPQVFKMKGGKSYAARLPHPSLVQPSVETIARRNRFKLTLKMSKRMHDIPQLKYLWKNYIIEDESEKISAFNKMTKLTYQRMAATGPLDTARIVPYVGFEVTADITLTNTQYTAELQAIGSSTIIDTAVEKYVYLVCVTHLYTPINPDDRANVFFSLVSSRSNLSITNPMTINVELGDFNRQIYDEYTNRKVFFALVTTDANEVPVHYSNTFYSA
jgi:hypothetical protein